ncbi:hypothetical protein [Legionella santicrucis]|uniref:hypothetical protein n=1 Tax=Legionella santicrucis TaxID=45074 RepID=UPI00072FF6ED|nr:hypothetical protein [Legionella santicrucis]
MDFKIEGDAIVQRRQRVWIGFQQTVQADKVYTVKDIKIKNKWVKGIEATNDKWRQWLNSIPTKRN